MKNNDEEDKAIEDAYADAVKESEEILKKRDDFTDKMIRKKVKWHDRLVLRIFGWASRYLSTRVRLLNDPEEGFGIEIYGEKHFIEDGEAKSHSPY